MSFKPPTHGRYEQYSKKDNQQTVYISNQQPQQIGLMYMQPQQIYQPQHQFVVVGPQILSQTIFVPKQKKCCCRCNTDITGSDHTLCNLCYRNYVDEKQRKQQQLLQQQQFMVFGQQSESKFKNPSSVVSVICNGITVKYIKVSEGENDPGTYYPHTDSNRNVLFFQQSSKPWLKFQYGKKV